MLTAELLVIISQHACNDDGTSVRALVSVSRLFYSWSLPFLYPNIAVHDAFRTRLLGLPVHTEYLI